MPNRVLCDRNITTENKSKIYSASVNSILKYSRDIWPMKNSTDRMLRTIEMD